MKKIKQAAPPPPISEFRLPRYRELTDVGLYLEQVVRLLNSYLAPLGEGQLTASMVSNYVKQKLLPRPEKKLYYAPHLARLIFIGTAKTVAALDDVRLLLDLLERDDLASAYDAFCASFEDAVKRAFGLADAAEGADGPQDEGDALLRRLVDTAAGKVYLDHLLREYRAKAE
ncbi:MAG: DUF1836 domain-containing protein [Firmicutes bacterium]|nr:DUF1836 domain-containing protein [Bacillota bacterium]